MRYYRIDVYVPESHLESVCGAMFDSGAGQLGRYDRCCWCVRGSGEFRPLSGANPFLGQPGRVERTPEWKVELICPEERLHAVLSAMTAAHPYETPACQYWPVELDLPKKGAAK